MKKNESYEEFVKGIWRDNPVFVQVLGMCPMLAVTNSAINAIAMGMASMFVLVGSSFLVSLFRHVIPKQVRISCFIIIIATFVTIADYTLLALVPAVHKELGAFIPLIVANCLILGRQEAFASRYPTRLADKKSLLSLTYRYFLYPHWKSSEFSRLLKLRLKFMPAGNSALKLPS